MKVKFFALCNTCSLLILLCFAETFAQSGVLLDGDYIQGGLVQGHSDRKIKSIFLNSKAVMVDDTGTFVFGFGRDAPPEQQLKITFADGEVFEQTLNIRARDYIEQRIDGLANNKVTPNSDALKRIRRESAEIRTARSEKGRRAFYARGFIWPVEGRITGVYGSRRILNGKPRRPHFGVDVAAPVGTAVKAPAAGKITYTNEDMYFSGGTIVLDHGHGLSSSFLHMSAISVSEGQVVEQGEVIGRVGATGRVTGPHLDWRMNWQGAYIDPQLLPGPMRR